MATKRLYLITGLVLAFICSMVLGFVFMFGGTVRADAATDHGSHIGFSAFRSILSARRCRGERNHLDRRWSNRHYALSERPYYVDDGDGRYKYFESV